MLCETDVAAFNASSRNFFFFPFPLPRPHRLHRFPQDKLITTILKDNIIGYKPKLFNWQITLNRGYGFAFKLKHPEKIRDWRTRRGLGYRRGVCTCTACCRSSQDAVTRWNSETLFVLMARQNLRCAEISKRDVLTRRCKSKLKLIEVAHQQWLQTSFSGLEI